jgi:dihydropteroate synthase
MLLPGELVIASSYDAAGRATPEGRTGRFTTARLPGGKIRRMATLRLHTGELRFGDVTHVMAVVNLSPESKNRQSVALTAEDAVTMAHRYREMGASVIDLGGQSSHFENPTIAEAEELARLLPVVERLAADGFVLSIDTWKPSVAAACIEAGAVLVNDTGGMADPEMRRIAATPGVGAFVMYIEGSHPHDVGEVSIEADKGATTADWMSGRLAELTAAGVTETIVDPGISINYRGDYEAYTRMQLAVIRDLSVFRGLGRPVLVPIPRKKEDHRVAAYISLALEHGADVVRVHDVEMACDLVSLFERSP